MYDKIRVHVEDIFQNVPPTGRSIDLKEELIANLSDKYADLIQQGETEEAAFGIVMAGIGDMDELIRSLREQQVWGATPLQQHQHRSALFISVAVALMILSISFPIAFAVLAQYIGRPTVAFIGLALMFVAIAFAVGLLIYNAKTKPHYKTGDTLVADFKAWNTRKSNRDSFYKTLRVLVYTLTVPLFLCLGIFFGAWHPGWLVFVLAPAADQVFKLIIINQDSN